MINLGCLITICTNHAAGYLVHNNEQIYQIIIVLLRLQNQFAINRCCEQIQVQGGT